MSILKPVFGVDLHAEFQRGFDFKRAAKQGYKFAFHKASQGIGYVPQGFEDFYERSEDAMSVSGCYHFLQAGPTGVDQAHHFLNTIAKVGGHTGKLLAVDFEAFGDLSPNNTQLLQFIDTVKRATNRHAVIIYSSVSYWNSGTPSGHLSSYWADAAWEAKYADMLGHRVPKAYYQAVRHWYGWNVGFGGVRPHFWQFTSSGRVGGMYTDVNAFRGSMDDLMLLTTRAS